VLELLNCRKRLLVMVALLAVLVFINVAIPLFMMTALPAELLPTKFRPKLLVMVTLPPLMPAPLKVSEKGFAMVKVYAGAPALNVNPPTVVTIVGAENDRLVTFDAPKNAVPVGTVAGVQLPALLKSPEPEVDSEPGVDSQVAFCACADVAASNAAATAVVANKCVPISPPAARASDPD
jgi:hypothetical protein